MGGWSKLRTRVRASVHNTLTHPKTTKTGCAAWLLSKRHLRKHNQRLQLSQIPEVLLWCWGMCFIFSVSLLYSHHELIRMMLLHTWGPCGKSCESDRPALQGKPIDSQCPFFPHILPLFLDGPYIIITRWPLLCPLDQLLLTHSGENRAALWTELSNTLHSGGGNFVIQS